MGDSAAPVYGKRVFSWYERFGCFTFPYRFASGNEMIAPLKGPLPLAEKDSSFP
jgi:hypothetical protein